MLEPAAEKGEPWEAANRKPQGRYSAVVRGFAGKQAKRQAQPEAGEPKGPEPEG